MMTLRRLLWNKSVWKRISVAEKQVNNKRIGTQAIEVSIHDWKEKTMESKFKNTDTMGKRKEEFEGEKGTTGIEGKDKQRTKDESHFEDYTNSTTNTMDKPMDEYDGEKGTTGIEGKDKQRTKEDSKFEDYTNSTTNTMGKRDEDIEGEEGTTDVERKDD